MTFIVLLVARLDSVDQVAAKNCGKEFKSKSHSHFGREAILKITVRDPFIIDERKWTEETGQSCSKTYLQGSKEDTILLSNV